jgi:hypothetical protein
LLRPFCDKQQTKNSGKNGIFCKVRI